MSLYLILEIVYILILISKYLNNLKITKTIYYIY